ncbi:ribokinase [Pimelobacter simplex]|uniref:ribokinase n=1 Tax=Nocardioides simplex TaxID=2045 RepID=UPI001932F839|nr:ribokinase [Pimelobacter simplex]
MSGGPLVCVVGSLNEDTTLRVPGLPRPGETVLATDSFRAPGGKGANQAAAAAVLGRARGASVAMVGAVGDDDAGERSVAALAVCGVGVAGVRRLDAVATGTAVVVVDDAGENHIVVDPGANGALAAGEVERAVGDLRPAVVLAQLEVTPACIEAAARAVPEACVILNPAPMPADPAFVLELLDRVDVLVPNQAELGRLAGRPTPQTPAEVADCAAALAFTGDLVVTMGAHGTYVVPRDGAASHVAAWPVDVVDTSGAGDVFAGCLAVALACGADLVDAVTEANRAAGRSTELAGARVPADFTG